MTSMLVKFEQPEQVVDFVNTLSHYDCDADIKYGSRMVDAKSVLGVLYLAVSRTVELILHIDEDGSGDIKKQTCEICSIEICSINRTGFKKAAGYDGCF